MVLTEGARRILVVDDDETIRRLVSLILNRAGYAVVLAADGREALQQIEAARPDLVVLDLMMPVLDGWGVLAHLRRMSDPPPVVILSAAGDRRRALREGATECLSKPFGFGHFVETCARVLNARSGRPTLEGRCQ